MNYGERLRILREREEKTQAEIAQVINTTQSYYAQYERNERSIPFERAVELARHYKVSLDYIAGFTDNINKNWR